MPPYDIKLCGAALCSYPFYEGVNGMSQTLLGHILADKSGKKSFAMLYRPQVCGPDTLDIMMGPIHQTETLQAISLPDNQPSSRDNHTDSVLVLIPYRQLEERNFACIDDGAQLIAMQIAERETLSIKEAMKRLPNLSIDISDGDFGIDDASYANIVQDIVKNEIGSGEGSNFVFSRQFTAEISNYSVQTALSLFRHLLQNEVGSYWTFIIHTGDRTFVGASPELHVSLQNGIATMNPISGTYRYPQSGSTLAGIMDFLSIEKEVDELYMVVEEELKMISHFCPEGGKLMGPYLKEMSQLAHTEYFVQGRTTHEPREILRATLFAPTVTGSPIENACRVISKYELSGRGYYGGVAALISRDASGQQSLDSTILIRTADIDNSGHMAIGVGATIVRHSNPNEEALETRVKAKALLEAMKCGG
jgi:phenazine biosynthesis protein phzE